MTRELPSYTNAVLSSMRLPHTNAFLSSPSQLSNVALVFLNSASARPRSAGSAADSLFERVWNCARFRVCADGAANRLYDGLGSDAQRRAFLPHLIKGDLDSIRPEVRSYYSGLGVEVVRDPDDDHHDLDKCLMSLDAVQTAWRKDGEEAMTVIVLGAFGGRLDHEMANINMLFRWQSTFGRLLLVSDESTAILLAPGEHEIRPNTQVEGRTCGLIPLGGPCARVTTTGLRWNLNEQPLAFGGMVSTSNEIAAPVVTVRTDGSLLWTTVLRDAQ